MEVFCRGLDCVECVVGWKLWDSWENVKLWVFIIGGVISLCVYGFVKYGDYYRFVGCDIFVIFCSYI